MARQLTQIVWKKSELAQVQAIISNSGGVVDSVSLFSHYPKRWIVAYHMPEKFLADCEDRAGLV